jgi:hypothetical protein
VPVAVEEFDAFPDALPCRVPDNRDGTEGVSRFDDVAVDAFAGLVGWLRAVEFIGTIFVEGPVLDAGSAPTTGRDVVSLAATALSPPSTNATAPKPTAVAATAATIQPRINGTPRMSTIVRVNRSHTV